MTRAQAEAERLLKPHPHNWYVWQMNDGCWHCSLMTNREA